MSKPRVKYDFSQRMKKRFVRYEEGAELYSMSVTKFSALAKKAEAVYKIDRLVLVNCDVIERYLERYRVTTDDADLDDFASDME